MKTIHAFRILLVLVMVILPMMAATPAYAGGLTHHQMVIDMGEEDIPWPGAPCGGINILIDVEGYLRVNYWTDENELWIKELDIYGTVKHTATANGKTVNILVQGPVHYEYTYTPDTVVMLSKGTGTTSMITAPGYGKIWGGAVNMVETYTFDANNWDLLDYSLDRLVGNLDKDFTELCAYFGS